VPAFCWGLQYFVRLPYVILVGVIFFPIALLLAFYKPNGRSLTSAMAGLLKYIRRPQMYIWKRIPTTTKTSPQVKKQQKIKINPNKSDKKVKDFKKLAETLDEGIN